MAIGPEGGFTDEEVEQALACGWRAVGLGGNLLRIETAGLAAGRRVAGPERRSGRVIDWSFVLGGLAVGLVAGVLGGMFGIGGGLIMVPAMILFFGFPPRRRPGPRWSPSSCRSACSG